MRLLAFALAGSLAVLAGCGGATKPGKSAPVVASFTAAPASILPGAASTLSWSATGADSITIDHGVGDVGSATSIAVSPAITTEYTLTATNAAGSATATTTVTVTAAPVPAIVAFNASPATIGAGGASTLAWSVSGATALSIDHGVGDVTGKLNVAVSPAATTTYTLTATNAAGSATATAQVTVTPAPGIVTFAASPASINPGGSSTLSWSVTGATSLGIDNGVGDVTGKTSIHVTPAATTTYTLTARGAGGASSATAKVTVSQAPSIVSFAATPASINAGAGSTLSWSVTGAVTLSIDNGVGDVTGKTSIGVTPAATTTYTLTAINPAGQTQQQAVVSVLQKPTISAFAAAPASINVGAGSTLSWTVAGATMLSIDNGVGDVTGKTSIGVTPAASTTYTLTATNAAGSTQLQTAVTVLQKPAISAFSASPATIGAGASSTLSWTATGATTLGIDNGVGDVTGRTSIGVSPAATTMYTLTAMNAAGNATKQTVVTVTAVVPTINSFSATPSPVTANGQVALAWDVSNATSVSIDHGAPGISGATGSVNVSPASSVTYRLTATSSAGSVSRAATVTVNPASAAPVIASFTADALAVPSGGQTTLRWSVSGSPALTLNSSSVTGTSKSTGALTQSTTYTLGASNASGNASASVTVAVISQALITPGDPGAADVTFALDSSQQVHPISRFIYGYNAGQSVAGNSGITLQRLGGNRWTAYNWETNASNAGSDYIFENDSYLSGSVTPAAAITPTVNAAQAAGQASLVTVPLQGWVSADENSAQPATTTQPVTAHFNQSLPRKSASLVYPPDTTDHAVYQDELVSRLASLYPGAFADAVKPLWLELDNEPDLWGRYNGQPAGQTSTHMEIQRVPLTYAAMIRLSIDEAAALKDAAPAVQLFGPVSYGFNGYTNLQSATDATSNEWWLDYYLRNMKAAGDAQGRRLLDVLDLHWYSSALTPAPDYIAITSGDNSAATQATRVQAPRSLWDSTYKENSWIVNDYLVYTDGAANDSIKLIPRLKTIIANQFPGTKLAFTEYNHGGGDDISGAVAQADTLGIFGREGVFAATFWELIANNTAIDAAFRAFRNFDGAGGAFGDTSFSCAQSTSLFVSCSGSNANEAKASIYASIDSTNAGRVVLVIINKQAPPAANLNVGIKLTHTQAFTKAHAYQVVKSSSSGTAAAPVALADVSAVGTNAFNVSVPSYSITTLVLVP